MCGRRPHRSGEIGPQDTVTGRHVGPQTYSRMPSHLRRYFNLDERIDDRSGLIRSMRCQSLVRQALLHADGNNSRALFQYELRLFDYGY